MGSQNKRIAMQLYSLHQYCEQDLAGVLGRLAEIGYGGVEFAGSHGHAAARIREWLRASGLHCAGTHIAYTDLLTPGVFQATLEFHQALGATTLIVPSLPDGLTQTLEDWQRQADTFNAWSAPLQAAGLRLGVHNHTVEFLPVAGVWPWTVFFQRADPEICMQVDTGNAVEAGVDPVSLLRTHAARCRTVHLKDYSPDPAPSRMGQGRVPWSGVLSACHEIQPEWLIAELGKNSGEAWEACRQSLRFITQGISKAGA
jgi:sugar phosphate isomerase/epimerase